MGFNNDTGIPLGDAFSLFGLCECVCVCVFLCVFSNRPLKNPKYILCPIFCLGVCVFSVSVCVSVCLSVLVYFSEM